MERVDCIRLLGSTTVSVDPRLSLHLRNHIAQQAVRHPFDGWMYRVLWMLHTIIAILCNCRCSRAAFCVCSDLFYVGPYLYFYRLIFFKALCLFFTICLFHASYLFYALPLFFFFFKLIPPFILFSSITTPHPAANLVVRAIQ